MLLRSNQVRYLVAVLMIASARIHAQEKTPTADEDFLDYLGTVEADGDDWTVFEDQEMKPSPEARKPTVQPAKADAKPASKQPPSTQTASEHK